MMSKKKLYLYKTKNIKVFKFSYHSSRWFIGFKQRNRQQQKKGKKTKLTGFKFMLIISVVKKFINN